MARIAIWMEGAHHPFEEIRAWQKAFLERLGHDAFFADIRVLLSESPPASDLWILGGLVYSGMGESYAPLTGIEAERLIARGGKSQPMLSVHSVIGSWDDRPELDGVWDGRWNWDTSRHSTVEPFRVRPTPFLQSLVAGLDEFNVTDELYYNLTYPKVSTVVLTADYEGQEWPLAWASANHVYMGLGHDLRSWNCPGTQVFFGNAVRYLLGERP